MILISKVFKKKKKNIANISKKIHNLIQSLIRIKQNYIIMKYTKKINLREHNKMLNNYLIKLIVFKVIWRTFKETTAHKVKVKSNQY